MKVRKGRRGWRGWKKRYTGFPLTSYHTYRKKGKMCHQCKNEVSET